MSAPALTSDDFLSAFQALMPRGRVWTSDPDATQTKVFRGITSIYAQNTARANYLLVDVFPATTVELLPEWESTLGLPDPCAGPAPTIQARRAQVVARLAATGGQSVSYFTRLAANLGYAITITQFSPFRFGQSNFGTPLYGIPWAFAWQVNAPTFSVKSFLFGNSAYGEPFAAWNNNVLQCELQIYAPAHTQLLFKYS
ncbi:YmfQ family protein [Burkholderia stagnalis]|uniref:YmfQ family protein n=1 Tax=Burkholderia stagnalis TaxID=1503054 RepID=UPI0007532954|nr:YmfQ family protein [Burkholderia stagnalis]KVC66608.1 phage tail protein [Burkholderia stagnalis]KVN24415.1 phage tail protein [Burkholderia stagnalis]KWK59711.1 phage tail protein [Burkholderia stagnalis]